MSFAELGSQSEFPNSIFSSRNERRVTRRERPTMHDNGLRFEVVNGVITPEIRLRQIRKLYTPDGYVCGMDVYGIFDEIYENKTAVEVIEATATTPAKIRPLYRDGLPPVQYRSIIRLPEDKIFPLSSERPKANLGNPETLRLKPKN